MSEENELSKRSFAARSQGVGISLDKNKIKNF